MRTVLRNRYYCDHCKKAGGSAGHMRTHEQHCTSNPERKCRMCALADRETLSIDENHKLVLEKGFAIASKEMCPACLLAAIRQRDCEPKEATSDWHQTDNWKAWCEWQYKDASKAFVAEHSRHQDRDYY